MSDEHEHRGRLEFWTPAGADRLQASAAELIAAVSEHANAVSAAQGEADMPLVWAASDRLLEVAVAYAWAQTEYTGTGFPFSVLMPYLDDEDQDEEEVDPAVSPSGISVISRRDYEVVDPDAVLRAGREAYLRLWPDDGEAAAAADVNHLGRAIYQLAHADGWESLRRVDGLSAVAGRTVVHRREDLLEGNQIRTTGQRTCSRQRTPS